MNAADNLLKSGAAEAGWDGVAVIADDETLTYGDLAQRVASYAQGLRGHGVSRGDRVALRPRCMRSFRLTRCRSHRPQEDGQDDDAGESSRRRLGFRYQRQGGTEAAGRRNS